MTDKVGVSSWHRLYGYRGDLYQELTLPGRPTIFHYRIPRKRLASALMQGGEITSDAWQFAQRNNAPEDFAIGGQKDRSGAADQRSAGGGYDETGQVVKDHSSGRGDGGLFA